MNDAFEGSGEPDDGGREIQLLRGADRLDRLLEADARELHEDLVVPLRLHRRLRDTERVDPVVDDGDRRLLRLLQRGALRWPAPAVTARGVVEPVADLDGELRPALQVETLVDEEIASEERRRRRQRLPERLMDDQVPVDEAVPVDEEGADHHEEDDGQTESRDPEHRSSSLPGLSAQPTVALRAERREGMLADRGSGVLHQPRQVGDVVEADEPVGEDLAGLEQMSQVRA